MKEDGKAIIKVILNVLLLPLETGENLFSFPVTQLLTIP